MQLFPSPGRKGLCGTLTLLRSGHIPGQRPGLLTRTWPWAEARGRGGGSQWASVPAHKRPLWWSSQPHTPPTSSTYSAPRSLAPPLAVVQGRHSIPSQDPLQHLAQDLTDPLSLSRRGRTLWLGVCTPLGLKDRESVEGTPPMSHILTRYHMCSLQPQDPCTCQFLCCTGLFSQTPQVAHPFPALNPHGKMYPHSP